MPQKRKCDSCFPIKQFTVCDDLAACIQALHDEEKKTKQWSKPRTVEKILREFFGIKKAS